MMRAICLALAFLALQDPADKVRALVEKLGSDEIAVREEAERDLARLGQAIVPALRKAEAASAGEQKIRLRRVIDRITAFGRPVQVSIEATDQPLRDIAGALERQTGIPFRLTGAAAEAKSTVSAKNVVVWKVVEDICRARGDLMYRFKDDAIEIYPSKFRAMPSVDKDGLRFFIDRFVWNGNHFWQYGALLAPRGARVIRIYPRLDESVDDLGNDPLRRPLHRMEPVYNGGPAYPSSSRIVYPFYFNRPNDPPPAREATKIVRCRGTLEVWLAGEERVLAAVPDPLAAPSVQAGAGIPSLGIKKWKLEDGTLSLHVTATYDEPSVRFLDHRLGPRMILRLKDGRWRSIEHSWQEESSLSPNEVKRIDRIYWFGWPEGSVAAALELVGPDRIIKVEIPFDFRDIPLR